MRPPLSRSPSRRRPRRRSLPALAALALVAALLTAGVTAAVPARPAHAAPGEVCRLTFTVTTGVDGLHSTSTETISFGGAAVLFEDGDGDGATDPAPQPFHRGGTGDTRHATFTWHALLSPCVPAKHLVDGFTFTHESTADDWQADNWNLQALRVVDRDTEAVYFDRASTDLEHPLHRFYKNADQTWNTNEGRPDADTDGDGLTDRVELFGIPRPGGAPDTWLPDHGADPCRKTVAVEIDWLDDGTASDRPTETALDEARLMFGEAPVNAPGLCPYGPPSRAGVQMLLDLSDAIVVTPEARRRPLREKGPDGLNDFDRHREANFPAHRRDLFFYSLWGYKHDASSSSGLAPVEGYRNDFIVSVGSWDRPSDRVMSGTFVHELGHVLGLGHGGTDGVNLKPNHLSVMSYRYQLIGVPDFSAWEAALGRLSPDSDVNLWGETVEAVSDIDYSREKLADLDMTRLVEARGVGSATGKVAAWWDDTYTLRAGDARKALDWDWSGGGVPDPDPSREMSVNLMSATQVCVTPFNPVTQRWDGLQTVLPPESADEPAHDHVFTGPDDECSTMADAADTQVENPDYPGRGARLIGADEWRAIRFGVGVSPDAGAPPPFSPERGPTEEEGKRIVSELVDAMVAAAAPPASTAPRWGFAYMDKATAPIGVQTPLEGIFQWTTGRRDPATAGHRAAVTRTGTGEYAVRLPDIASESGVAHVTAYRTTYRGRTCAVAGHEPSGADEVVRVRCFDHTGAPVDWWFTVFFAAPRSGDATYATIRYNPPGGAGSLTPVRNPGTHNSAGQVNHVLHDGPGRYRAVLKGAAFTADTGYAQVTPYGTGAAARCNPEGTTVAGGALEVTVACYAIDGGPTARPADSPWLLSYVQGTGLNNDPSAPAAYATTTGDPANPTIDPRHSYASTGETPTVTRLSTGWYRVTYTTLGKPTDSAQVTSTTPGHYCHLGTLNSYSAPPNLGIDLYCHSPSGTPANSTFALTYLRSP
ncbi:hypothetical protein [Sphaerisporangium sp. TRM90804]|uniref:hypothetical protein n=1 Tax=Sphaerisporangium sp. TRM90804 TaxID=3031113 RepID=UPI00244A734C|nr:hypothetical protein [Sphaerisporangium sp. TRM90804]MDH2424960.1 hypothetical protein [Sphaerisporangium sp. TRM90804]